MWLALGAVIAGLLVLVWSADRFVDGASATARHAGMPTLLIGMLVIGFGTSAPEMVGSALASADGNPGLALGNAYGSNITNIALILGLVALLSPISVHSSVLRRELPVLAVIMLLAMEISFTTPPFGLLLFVMQGVAPPGTKFSEICLAAIPFMACAMLLVALILAFPSVVTWLPFLTG